MKLLAPSTPNVRIPKAHSGASAILVTAETLTRRVKVKLLLHGGEGMTRIDEGKSSHQVCTLSHLYCRIYARFFNYLYFVTNSIDGYLIVNFKEQGTRIKLKY